MKKELLQIDETPEILPPPQKTTQNKLSKLKSHPIVKTFQTLSKKSANTLIGYLIFFILLCFSAQFLIIPGIAHLFEISSPWAGQRSEIAAKNNIRDAYSAIIGSDVGLISNNGFVKWFTSREAKEMDISIPKLINYSPLFNDDSQREQLKATFKDSINNDIAQQSVANYKIFYDGHTIIEVENGEKIKSFKDLSKGDKEVIQIDLEKRIYNATQVKFSAWEPLEKQQNVDFTFEPSSNTVSINGYFLTPKDFFFFNEKKFHVTAQYKYEYAEWHIVPDSLKVEEVKK